MFNPKRLSMHDPVIRGLWFLSDGSIWRVAILALILNIGLCLGLGTLIALSSAPSRPLNPFDPHIFPIEGFIYCITLPAIWIYYTIEPRRIIAIFYELAHHGVIEDTRKHGPTIEQFLEEESKAFQKPLVSWFALFLTGLIFLLWFSVVFLPNNPFYFGHPHAWYEVNRFYFWGVWIPLVYIGIYMFWQIFIRRFLALRLIARFLETFPLTPKLFHPDGANGFSPIGDYPIRFTPLMLIAGVWVFLVIAYPLFFGHRINLNYDTAFYIFLYVLLTSVGFMVPVWNAHQVMLHARQHALESVAQEIQDLLPSFHLLHPRHHEMTVKEQIEKVEALERYYHLLKREYHTWPFNLASLSQFLLGTALPLLSSGVSIIFSWFSRP